MKIAHMSDQHYSPGNLVEADRCFGFAVEDAIHRGVEAAILTGDSTDHRLEAHSPALLALAKRVKQMADHCPVLALQGTFSHEPQGMLHMLAMIGAKYQIVVADRIGQIGLTPENQWTPITPDNERNPYKLVVTAVPTVNKADLVPIVGFENASEAMGEYLASLLASFAPANRRFHDRGIPTVLATHGTVSGSTNESGVPMAGPDHEFTTGTLYAAGTDAVMVGHIHLHQAWTREFNGRQQTIAYAGSIGRFHHGEIGDKYYLEWDVVPSAPQYIPVVTPSRQTIDIEFDGVPDLKQLESLAEGVDGAYVRVIYKVDEEYAKTIDRNAIKQILSAAADVTFKGTVLAIERQRCAGISRLPALADRFNKYCELSQTPTEGLQERLQTLQSMDPVDIVSKIVRPTAIPA